MSTTPQSSQQKSSQLRWRCRRGVKELDIVLEKYLRQHYGTAKKSEQRAFSELLDWEDPQLLSLLMGDIESATPAQVNVLKKLRHRFTQNKLS